MICFRDYITKNKTDSWKVEMMNEHEFSTEWENADIQLRVPFSFPGISTSVIISSVKDQSYHVCDTGDGILKSLCFDMDFNNTLENLKV